METYLTIYVCTDPTCAKRFLVYSRESHDEEQPYACPFCTGNVRVVKDIRTNVERG